MIDVRFGDVILAPFPFTDMDVLKPRPGVIISAKHLFDHHEHVWVLMITRAKRSDWSSDIDITDSKSAGLVGNSKMRMKVACMHKYQIKRHLGRLAPADLRALKRGLADVISDAE